MEGSSISGNSLSHQENLKHRNAKTGRARAATPWSSKSSRTGPLYRVSVLGQAGVCASIKRDPSKASYDLAERNPAHFLPSLSVTTTSASRAEETLSPAHRAAQEPGLGTLHTHSNAYRPLGTCIQHIRMQVGTHAYRGTHTLRCALHTEHTHTHVMLCTHQSIWVTYPHVHRWLRKMLTQHRKICIEFFPASSVTARWWDSPTGLLFNALINF